MKRRSCGSCGSPEMKPFRKRAFEIEHAGYKTTVRGLAGWECAACGETEFDATSARRYGDAGDTLVLRDRKRTQSEIKRIRRKLGLSQASAARLTGGGHNAFSRYERGEVEPLPAVINLLKLLDKHPELLKELA